VQVRRIKTVGPAISRTKARDLGLTLEGLSGSFRSIGGHEKIKSSMALSGEIAGPGMTCCAVSALGEDFPGGCGGQFKA